MSVGFLVDLLNHKARIGRHLGKAALELAHRVLVHDMSKFKKPERPLFEQAYALFQKVTYGTKEYDASLQQVQPAIDHHYKENRHHPEYHPKGVVDMGLVDLLEMICDWKAASERKQNLGFAESLKKGRERFKIPYSLYKVIENEAYLRGWISERSEVHEATVFSEATSFGALIKNLQASREASPERRKELLEKSRELLERLRDDLEVVDEALPFLAYKVSEDDNFLAYLKHCLECFNL